MDKISIVNVKNCAQCGGNHDNLQFEYIADPVDEFERDNPWRSVCPTNGQILYMRYVEDKVSVAANEERYQNWKLEYTKPGFQTAVTPNGG